MNEADRRIYVAVIAILQDLNMGIIGVGMAEKKIREVYRGR